MLDSERRETGGPAVRERRGFPRPPLWLNLLILLAGVAGIFYTRQHREKVETRFSSVIAEKSRTPQDLNQIKNQLAELDLTRDALSGELNNRIKFAESLKSNNFYLSVDTTAKKLRFYYGDTILREGELSIGESKTIPGAEGKKWTFVPLKGAFEVQSKSADHVWIVPEWVYVMNGQPVPSQRGTVRHGLGRYVVALPNGYVIHSPPSEESPLKGPKPGSFMAAEGDLRAIWDRLTRGTMVYVF